jgi:hypothetical protein
VCIYMYIYIFFCIYLTYSSNLHIWGKTRFWFYLLNIKFSSSIHLKKWRAGGKIRSFLGVDTSERWVGTRKEGMGIYMVDVFCIHILK